MAGGVVGSDHQGFVLESAPDGSWLVLCQARTERGHEERTLSHGRHGEVLGDPLTPYLVLGTGVGEAIDALVAADDTGRWLVIERAGALELLDFRTMQRTGLGPPARVRSRIAGGRWAWTVDGRTVVMRDLERELEQSVALEQDVASLLLGSAGRTLVARWAPVDPRAAPETASAGTRCPGRHRARLFSDDPESDPWQLVTFAEPATIALEATRALDGGLLGNTEVGLVLARPGVPDVVVAPAACGPTVEGTWEDPLAVLVRCEADEGRLSLWREAEGLVALGLAAVFPMPMAPLDVVVFSQPHVAIDLWTARTIPLPESVFHVVDRYALARSASRGELLVVDLDSGVERSVSDVDTSVPLAGRRFTERGRFVVIEDALIDLAQARVLRRVRGRIPPFDPRTPPPTEPSEVIHTITPEGLVLLGEEEHGPFVWRRAAP